MVKLKVFAPFIYCLILFSCSQPARIDGFDSESWKGDKFACSGVRQQMQTDFEGIRRQLYGLTEKEVRDILGKPDGEELMTRGQRMFYYYLESGQQCETQGRQLSMANRAEIRFSALTKVSEITYARPIEK